MAPVGLGTMMAAETLGLVLTGSDKRAATAPLLGLDAFDHEWPASIVHDHPGRGDLDRSRGARMRHLIVNADDLGFTEGVDRGILETHERGIVTSASLMVERPGTAHAVELAHGAPRLSVGLHVVLDERGALLVPPEQSARELERQLARFRELMRREPTHVDSHHHVHRDPRLTAAFVAFADRHGVPLRDHSSARHCGAFYGQGTGGVATPESISVERLLEIIGDLDDGTTEPACHAATPWDSARDIRTSGSTSCAR